MIGGRGSGVGVVGGGGNIFICALSCADSEAFVPYLGYMFNLKGQNIGYIVENSYLVMDIPMNNRP